jgi:hypothetical protein
MAADELRCPGCARLHDASERFCEDCGMPLVHARGGDAQASDLQRRMRKVKPQYTEGRPVRVARAGSEAEAELIAGLLLEEGIPCMLRRSPGFDVAEFMAAGPRDVLVPESAAQVAREALAFDPPAPGAGTSRDEGPGG